MPSKLRPETAREIQSICHRRGIYALYHFTPLSNLESILTHGLMSWRTLAQAGHAHTWTDNLRADLQPAAISVSIEDINHEMFDAKLRSMGCDFAILEISASILWTHDCRFCPQNAASSEIAYGTRMADPKSLERMFEDKRLQGGRSFRSAHGIPMYKPTRNDAEVQVFETITPRLIRDVTVKSEAGKAKAAAAMAQAERTLPIEINPDAFVPQT